MAEPTIADLYTAILAVDGRLARFAEHVEQRLDGIDLRFDGVEQRLDGIGVRLDGVAQRLDGIGVRLDGVEQRLDGIDLRFDGVAQRLDGIDLRFDGVEQRLDGIGVHLDGVEQRLDGIGVHLDGVAQRLDGIDLRLGRVEGALADLTEIVRTHIGYTERSFAQGYLTISESEFRLSARMDEGFAKIDVRLTRLEAGWQQIGLS